MQTAAPAIQTLAQRKQELEARLRRSTVDFADKASTAKNGCSVCLCMACICVCVCAYIRARVCVHMHACGGACAIRTFCDDCMRERACAYVCVHRRNLNVDGLALVCTAGCRKWLLSLHSVAQCWPGRRTSWHGCWSGRHGCLSIPTFCYRLWTRSAAFSRTAASLWSSPLSVGAAAWHGGRGFQTCCSC